MPRVAALLLAFLTACQAGPPAESGRFRVTELVDVIRIEPGIHLEIRYAGANNFAGRPFYPAERAFLQRPAALALARVHKAFKADGYGILIYDAYRPWSVTKALWDAASAAERAQGYVADPSTGSKHNRGCAVDVGLYELRSGAAVAMPSGYDEFSERASPDYTGGTDAARQHRDTLRRAMEAEGFEISKNEWWHFNYRDWPHYRLLDVSFEDLPR